MAPRSRRARRDAIETKTVEELFIGGVWTVVGLIFATRMDVPEYNPEL